MLETLQDILKLNPYERGTAEHQDWIDGCHDGYRGETPKKTSRSYQDAWLRGNRTFCGEGNRYPAVVISRWCN